MMNIADKIDLLSQLVDERFADADHKLLSRLSPFHPEVVTTLPVESRGEAIVYALLDLTDEDTIRDNRAASIEETDGSNAEETSEQQEDGVGDKKSETSGNVDSNNAEEAGEQQGDGNHAESANASDLADLSDRLDSTESDVNDLRSDVDALSEQLEEEQKKSEE